MTTPHSSGSKLGSAYIEATVKVKDGKNDVKTQLDGYADVAADSGAKIGEELHKGILAYVPSKGAVDAWANSLADNQLTSVHRAMASSTSLAITGDTMAKAIADGSLKSFESGSARDNVDRAADTFRGHLADGIRTGLGEAGDGAASGFRGTFLTSLATGLEGEGGIRSVFSGAFNDAKGVYTEGGQSAAEGFFRSFTDKIGGSKFFDGAAIGGAFEGIKDKLSFDLSGGLGKVKETSEGASKALAVTGTEAGGVAEKLGGLAGAAELLANPYVLAAAATLGVVGTLGLALDKFNELGEEWEKVDDQITVATGGSVAQVEALSEQVQNIAGQTAAPLDQIADNVATVSTLFNQTGDNVGKVAEQVTKAQNLFGKFDTVGVSRSFAAFGITDADKQIDALNDYAHGFEAARIPIDQMAGAVERVSPIASQFGLDIHSTTGLLTEFARSGVEPERATLSLTTAFKNLRDTKIDKFLSGEGITVDKDNLNGSLTTVLKTLQDLEKVNPLDPKASDIAAKVFGAGQRGGGAAVQQALKPGVGQLNPDDLAAPIDAIKPNIDELTDRTEHAGQEWEKFKNQVDVALKPAADAIHTFVDKSLGELIHFFSAHQAEIAQFFSFIGEAAVRMGQGITFVVSGIIGTFGLLTHSAGLVIDAFGGILRGLAAIVDHIPSFLGGGEAVGDSMRRGADDIHNFSDGVIGAGKTLEDAANSGFKFANGTMNDLANTVGHAGDNVKDASDKVTGLDLALQAVGKEPPPKIDVDTTAAATKVDDLLDKLKQLATGADAPPPQAPIAGLPAGVYGGLADVHPGVNNPLAALVPHNADGGGIYGSGTKGKDSIFSMLAPGEHVWTADEVDAAGGQDAVYHLRAMAKAGILKGFQDGGAVDVEVADSLAGEKYSQGNRADCSGMVGRVVEGATGVGGGLPTTKNMGEWLSERGFKPGTGGPGQISVGWYDHGPNPNDGHAAMTLSSGQNAESGPDGKFVVGGDAHGASASEFDHHMYLPQVWGEGSGSGNGLSGAAPGSAPSGAAIQAAGDKVSSAQGAVDVATQKLQEAQDKPLSVSKKGKLGKNAQADHDKAVTDAQAALDKANRDLDTAKGDQANLLDGSGDPKAVTAAQNALADAKGRVTDAQAKLDAVMADPKHKPSDETAAQNALAAANTKAAEAQDKLTAAQTKADSAKPTKKEKELDPIDAIGNIGGDFLKDNLPPGFSDPTSWPLLKEGSNLLKIIGGQVKDPTAKALLSAGASGLGGDGSGVASSLEGLLPKLQIPGMPGGLDGPPAAGDGNGNTTNIDNSSTVSGVGDMDAAKQVVGEQNSGQTRSVRGLINATGLNRGSTG